MFEPYDYIFPKFSENYSNKNKSPNHIGKGIVYKYISDILCAELSLREFESLVFIWIVDSVSLVRAILLSFL